MQIMTNLPALLSRAYTALGFVITPLRSFFVWFGSFPAYLVLIWTRLVTGHVLSHWFFFISLLGPIVYKIIFYIGFTAVTYSGVHLVLDAVIELVQARSSALPSAAFQIMALMQLDVGLKMIISAGFVKLTLRGWDALSRSYQQMVWRPPFPIPGAGSGSGREF